MKLEDYFECSAEHPCMRKDGDCKKCAYYETSYSTVVDLLAEKEAGVDYWKNICDLQEKQTRKGIFTYGQTLEQNTELSTNQRLTMLEEELIDGLMYLEHIKAKLSEGDD